MNSKLIDSIVLILILGIGILYGRSSIGLGVGSTNNMGPGSYPFLLATILIFLILISLIQTLRKPAEEKIKLPNGKLILFTIGILAFFFLSWSIIGYFYLNLFIFIFVLYSIYTERLKKEFLIKNTLIPLIITFSIFIIFDLVLNLSF